MRRLHALFDAKSCALHTAQVAADIRRDKVNLQELFDAKLRRVHASARVHLRADARACMLGCTRALARVARVRSVLGVGARSTPTEHGGT